MNVNEKAHGLALKVQDWPDNPTFEDVETMILNALREAQQDGAEKMQEHAAHTIERPPEGASWGTLAHHAGVEAGRRVRAVDVDDVLDQEAGEDA